MKRRKYSASSTTTVRDLQRVMTKINATALRIEQDVLSGAVKVVFDRAGKRYTRTCTQHPDSTDNLRAIGLQITYLYRALDVLAYDVDGVSFDVEFDAIFGGLIAAPDDTALLLGDGKAAWHEVLGLTLPATRNDVRNAYKALMRVHHPDVGGAEEDAKKITTAFNEGMKAVKQ